MHARCVLLVVVHLIFDIDSRTAGRYVWVYHTYKTDVA